MGTTAPAMAFAQTKRERDATNFKSTIVYVETPRVTP